MNHLQTCTPYMRVESDQLQNTHSLSCVVYIYSDWISTFGLVQNEDYNTSDEEFERQLAEAAAATDSPSETGSVRGKAKTKVGRGQGKPPKKKGSHHLKKTHKFPSDPDADGYEVSTLFVISLYLQEMKWCTITVSFIRCILQNKYLI